MRKHKTQSLIGIFALVFGLACFVPALYWLRYETSYDSFYPDAEHIFRVYSFDKQSGESNELVSGILERKLHEQFPAMEASTVFFIEEDNCSSESMPHVKLRMLFSDSTFLKVFPQEFISGDAHQPLQVLNNIVLTETAAIRLFGDVENAIGQQIKTTLFVWFPQPYTVTAVIKDTPLNTNVSFDAILYHDNISQQKTFIETSNKQIWTFATLQGYVRFHPLTNIDNITEQLRDFPSRLDTDANMEVRILPVSNVRHHLNADVPFTLNFIRLFVAAGILLLCSALFNFLNLYLDLFRQRIREFHQRTVHGAKSGQLVLQMMFELICAILPALALAYCFVILSNPIFSKLLNFSIKISQLTNLFVVCGIAVIVLMLLISCIPFWRLSRSAMRNQSKTKTIAQPVLRRMAITLQLAVSVVFIVAALVVMMQMRFVNHKDLGFDSNGIIHLSGLSFYDDDVRPILKNELASIPQIESITDAVFEPQHNINTFNSEIRKMITEVEWPGKQEPETMTFQSIFTDSRFAETFGLKMKMGEWYNEVGENNVVLNEEAVRVMGLDEPVGAIIRIRGREFNVVGVVNDFHTLSLRSHIYPTIFQQFKYSMTDMYVRAVSGHEQEAIRRITAILPNIKASLADVHPTSLNELYDRLNRSEQAGLQLFSVLASVCLLISLFGIYAVAVAATQRRRKEIAIRKVFGAEIDRKSTV